MALSTFTGGGFANHSSYTPSMPISYYAPPTPPPRYDLDAPHRRMLQWNEERRRREKRERALVAGGGALTFDPNEDERRRKIIRSIKRRALKEEGVAEESVAEEGVAEEGVAEEGVAEYLEEGSVEPVACGEDVTLPCHAPDPDSVDGLEWTRTDLDRYVYLYKDGAPDLSDQHPDYRGRCELQDGTATLRLQNVTAADIGTYECRYVNHSSGVSKRAIITNDPVTAVRLRVTRTGACAEDEDEEEVPAVEGTGRHHLVLVGVGALVLLVFFFLVL